MSSSSSHGLIWTCRQQLRSSRFKGGYYLTIHNVVLAIIFGCGNGYVYSYDAVNVVSAAVHKDVNAARYVFVLPMAVTTASLIFDDGS
ncbi:hypothetical protein Tco_1357442 [Tanacetum coccineum]